jgi:hypothetical protein
MRTISFLIFLNLFFVFCSCKDSKLSRSETESTSYDEMNIYSDETNLNQDSPDGDTDKQLQEIIKTIDQNISDKNRDITLNIPGDVVLPKQYIVVMQEESVNGFLLSLQTDKKEGAKVTEAMLNLLKSTSFEDYQEQDLGSFITIFSSRNKANSLTYIFSFAENETGNILLSYTFLKS